MRDGDAVAAEQVERDVGQKRYGMLGITAFSPVAFDATGSTAAVGVAPCSGVRCSPPSVVFLNKSGSVWTVDVRPDDMGCLPMP